MKQFNLIFALFIGFFSVAGFGSKTSPQTPPTAVVGLFAYAGQAKVWRHTHAEILDVRNQKDQQKLVDLQSQGYECTLRASQQYLCRIDIPVTSVATEVQKRIDQIYHGLTLDLQVEVGAPALIYDGESYKRWSVSQLISVKQADGSKIGYKIADYDYVGELLKIYPGGVGANFGLCVVPNEKDQLEIQESIRLQPSRFQIETYFITVYLDRK